MQSLQTKAAYSGKSKGVSRGTVERSLTRPFLGRGSCWRPGAHSKLQILPGISQPGSMGFPRLGQFIDELLSPAALKRHRISNSISIIYSISIAALIARKRTPKGEKRRGLRGENKSAPVPAKRQRRKPLRYHSSCQTGAVQPLKSCPVTGATGETYCPHEFSSLLQGDIPRVLPSASHHTGGSLRVSKAGTCPFPRIFICVPYLIRFFLECQGENPVPGPDFVPSFKEF